MQPSSIRDDDAFHHALPARRVVITGLGVLAPNGIGKENFWQACISARSGIRRITRFDASLLITQIAGEVANFDPQALGVTREEQLSLDRGTQMAIAAANLALQDARLPSQLSKAQRNRIGVYIGSAMASVEEGEKLWVQLTNRGTHPPSALLNDIDPGVLLTSYIPASAVATHHQFHGPCMTISTGCSAGADAIGQAYLAIREGYADRMLTGGTDSAISYLGMNVYCVMKALSTRNQDPQRASRPYDRARDGFVMAEGAGVVFLEERDIALARGAHIYAELIAFVSNSNAHHMASLPEDGAPLQQLLRQTLHEAHLRPQQLGYINSHGSSTPLNEIVETAAYKAVFGQHAYRIPISATKSLIGHTQGAASAIETIVTTLVLEHQIIPPTINQEDTDPLCDLDYVPNVARYATVNVALTHSSGFGGVNTALILASGNATPVRRGPIHCAHGEGCGHPNALSPSTDTVPRAASPCDHDALKDSTSQNSVDPTYSGSDLTLVPMGSSQSSSFSLPLAAPGRKEEPPRTPTTLKRRVVVTGLGVVAPNGIGKEAFWDATHQGISAIKPVQRFSALPISVAGEVTDFAVEDYIDRKLAKRTDRMTHFVFAAVQEALQDAKILLAQENPHRVGAVIANTVGGVAYALEQIHASHVRGPRHMSAYTAMAWLQVANVGQTSIRYGFQGYCKTPINDTVGGLDALGIAYGAIQRGAADVIIAGGCEAFLHPYFLLVLACSGQCAIGNDPNAYRPFDERAAGLLLAEGAGICILEEYEHAQQRGAHIYGEIVGYSQTNDGHRLMVPTSDATQYARAIRLALQQSCLSPHQIGYFSLDGRANQASDQSEAEALRTVFGSQLAQLPISVPRTMLGHSYAAAGALDTITALLVLEHNLIPPTINCEELDPAYGLDLVRQARPLVRPAVLVGGRSNMGANVVLGIKGVSD